PPACGESHDAGRAEQSPTISDVGVDAGRGRPPRRCAPTYSAPDAAARDRPPGSGRIGGSRTRVVAEAVPSSLLGSSQRPAELQTESIEMPSVAREPVSEALIHGELGPHQSRLAPQYFHHAILTLHRSLH